MAFDEKTKKEVKEKAAYYCCICQKTSISVEVHHIIPQKDGGDDTIDNAAPLCPTCHADYGDNPEKRRGIKERRDWWYENVKKMYSSNITSQEQMKKIHSLVEKTITSMIVKQKKYNDDLKLELKEIMSNAIENMTPATSDMTISAVLNTAVSSVSSIQPLQQNNPEEQIRNIKCKFCKCIVSSSFCYCPNCGKQLY